MIKNIAWKIRLYPSRTQEIQINKTLGSCRFIYNNMLAEHIKAYEELKDNKRELYEYSYKTEKDYKKEFEWLSEVDSIALQQSRRDLVSAYSNFFKSLSGKRKGRSGFPKFHKKGQKESYKTQSVSNNLKIDSDNHKIKLPIIGWVNYRDQRNPEGKIKNITVSKTKTGKYFASILLEKEVEDIKPFNVEEALEKGLFVKGLDMSLEHFYVDDQGNSPEYQRLYRENEKKLVHFQRLVSKKKLGSNNRKKAQLRVNKIYEKIANSRKDFVEKLSTSLIEENDVIVLETLSLKGMSQALMLGKSIMDLGYSQFVKRLQDKALDKGKLIIQADKWFASSKTCSVCGYINKGLQLSDREWDCPNCGTHHLRDMNASINLREYGLNLILGQELPDVKPVEIASVDDRVKAPKKHTLEKPKKLGKNQEALKSLVSE